MPRSPDANEAASGGSQDSDSDHSELQFSQDVFTPERLIRTITELAGQVDDPEEALEKALGLFCESLAWPVGHAYRVAAGEIPLLVSTGRWHLDDGHAFAQFRAATAATTFVRGTGLVGEVWELARPRLRSDLGADTGFVRAAAARLDGLSTGLAFPILVGLEVVAVLELFDQEPRELPADAESLLLAAGMQLGRVFERERVRRQDAGREQQFQSLVENAPDVMARFDTEGLCLYVNPRLSELTGRPLEEFLGRSIQTLGFPEAIVSHWAALARTVVQTGRASAMELELPGCGSEYRLEARLVPETEPDGRVATILTLCRDVTDLRRLERELRAMIEAEPACVKVIGVDGTVLQTNRAGFEMLDAAKAEDVVGTNVFQYISPEDREQVTRIVESVFGGETRTFTFEAVTTKGRLRCFETTAAPYPDGGSSVNRILTVTRDITEARELEEQYRQAQKMEAIGRLAGGIAHDFNNMLGVINGYSELLLETLPPDSPMRSALGEIARAGDRAANLTRQLLAFSRKESVEPRVLDLKGVVGELRQMLARLIGEDVSLVTDFETRPSWVRADPGQIEQLLLNLVVNSRDAMPHGGRITLALRNEELVSGPSRTRSELAPGRYVRLSVADNGCGMDRATLERVFEPFFTTKPVGQGTGLGLATVFGIVQQSGGSISVDSELGRGTTFDIYLPLVEPESQSETASLDTPRRGSEVVLLVEDEPLVRNLVDNILSEYGYSVLLARSGDEALRVAAGHAGTIHLLLTDVVIPGDISARALAEQLTVLRPEICVLYMSGYMDDAVVRAGVGGPATHFMQKPFAPGDLARKVRDVLDAGPWHTRPCRILIIDDDEAARDSLAEVLEAEGYAVLTAASGREGLERLHTGPRPDLILLDLVMPGMNGWAFRSEQEKDPDLAQIPVVIVSGAQDPASAAGYLRTALSLSKPLDIPRLLLEIERHCRRP